jgi:hypothetical protein
MPVPGLRTHAPTGRIPWPLILLEGQEKSGRSWSIAEFSKSDKIGTLYWIDLNEGAAEEYGAIPGANYQVVEMDTGDYHELLHVLELLHKEASRARDAGEKPVALGIDSGTAIWAGLKDWASSRARSSSRGQALLRKDPHAEVKISTNLWNDSAQRWRKIQTLLATFPGPVIITARGKEVAVIGPDGNPVEGQREWSVDCHKELPYTATAWVRMQRTSPPMVIGARSVHAGIKPGADDPKPIEDPRAEGRLLEWLIFDLLRVDAARVGTRDYREFTGGDLTEEEKARPEEGEPDQSQTARRAARRAGDAQWLAAIAACTDLEGARRLWDKATLAGVLNLDIDGVDVRDRITARVEDIKAGRVGPDAQTAPAGPPSAPVPPAEAPQDVPAPAVAPAAADGPSQGPAGQPAEDLLAVSPTPDDPQACRTTAARRGVLSSLQALDVDDAGITERFGRPVEQVATRRLVALVREVITAQRAKPTTEQVPDDDVSDDDRETTLATLLEIYGGDPDALDAAAQDDYGKPLALIGQRRLSEMLTREQAGATS